MKFIKYALMMISFITNSSYAFRLSPLSDSIIIGKDKNTVVYQVTNNTKKPMAIEATLVKREMGIDGKENLPAVKQSNFIVYPNQIILKPGEKRGIKVTWLGQSDIKVEKAYRLKIEQLPIDFDKQNRNGIKIIMKYLGALYVSKDDFKSHITVKDIKVVGKDVVFVIENSGASHQLLRNLKIEVNKKVILEGKKLKGFSGENVLAGKIREFRLSKSLLATVPKASEVKLLYE